MSAAVPKLATLDDLLAIPEDERRHELIDAVEMSVGTFLGNEDDE